ncbi:MAG: amidohydrolase [Woeseia sp.]
MCKNRFLGLLALLPIVPYSGCEGPADSGADRVFVNAAVYTVDDDRSWAEAVAVTDGEIVFVGSTDDAAAFIGDGSAVTDLDGKMLMPGFHDAHAHVRFGGLSESECDLQYAADIGRIRELLIECREAYDYQADEWVLGGGWSLAAFPDADPSKDMLDEVFGSRPVLFGDAFGHNVWVSSRALEIAGIDSSTPDPPQGVIVRDPETGEPTGTLRDSAMGLVGQYVPDATAEQRYQGLMAGLRRARQFGITAYIEPGSNEDGIAPYVRADRRGDLTARVLVSLSPIGALSGKFGPEIFELLAKRDEFRGTYLSPDSVKVYIDGVIETRTSYMLEPYLNGENFPPYYQQDALNELYRKLDETGVQIHTHAIGDAAIRSALDAYEHALLQNGPSDNRHQIVHLQLIDAQDIPRFAELNVAADFQCLWCYPDVYIPYAAGVVGDERVQRFYPVRSVLDSGGLVVGGSDWNVSSLNPLDAIETAITRQNPFENAGSVLGKNQQIDLKAALDMYTRNAAHVMRLDDRTGTIEVGKRADLIVLDRNLFEIPVYEINEARVLMTMMDGRTVHSSAEQ